MHRPDIASGETIVISRKLGAGSEACNLDPGGLALACGLVEEADRTRRRCGRAEQIWQAGSLAKRPVRRLQSRHPRRHPRHNGRIPACREDWVCFAGGLAEYVAPDIGALAAWWRASHAGASDRA